MIESVGFLALIFFCSAIDLLARLEDCVCHFARVGFFSPNWTGFCATELDQFTNALDMHAQDALYFTSGKF